MKTALLIHSHPAANDIVARHWSWYQKSGLDIFGIGRDGNGCQWPDNAPYFNIGRVGRGDLSERLTATFELFLQNPRLADYTHAMVIESDAIFLGSPPYGHIEAAATLAGGPIAGFKANAFYHTPWWLNRDMANRFVSSARNLIRAGEVEQNSPDFFFALAFDRLGIPVGHLTGTFCRNVLGTYPGDFEAVRERVKSGQVWYVHGVKTREHLDAITA